MAAGSAFWWLALALRTGIMARLKMHAPGATTGGNVWNHLRQSAPQQLGATGAWRHVMQSVRACEAMGSRSRRSYGHHGDVIRASKHPMQLCEYMCCGRTTFAADRQARRRQSTDLVELSSRTCERVTGTCKDIATESRGWREQCEASRPWLRSAAQKGLEPPPCVGAWEDFVECDVTSRRYTRPGSLLTG